MSTDLMLKPASELAMLIKSRETSARELLDEAIARYEIFNPTVNAITEIRIEIARTRALAADEATAQGESWGPFHGLPVTIKEATVSNQPEDAIHNNLRTQPSTWWTAQDHI